MNKQPTLHAAAKHSASLPVVGIDPHAVNARFQLLVAMTWPRSNERRNEALATYAALQMQRAELEATHAQVHSRRDGAALTASDVAGMQKYIEDEILTPAGGYPAVARAAGVEHISRQIERTVHTIVPQVGGVLHFAAQLDWFHRDIGTASLNRAWHILEAENHPGQPRTAVRRGKTKVQDDISLFRATKWNDYACVAPLQAAYTRALSKHRAQALQQHGRWDGRVPEWSAEEIGIILGWAQWFRRWATGHVPIRAKKAFIPGNEAVIYETSAPEIEPKLEPLSPERLAVARSYHSRT